MTYLSLEALGNVRPGHTGHGKFFGVPESDPSLAFPSRSRPLRGMAEAPFILVQMEVAAVLPKVGFVVEA